MANAKGRIPSRAEAFSYYMGTLWEGMDEAAAAGNPWSDNALAHVQLFGGVHKPDERPPVNEEDGDFYEIFRFPDGSTIAISTDGNSTYVKR